MPYKIIGDMREQKIINEKTGESYYFEELVKVLNEQEGEIEKLKVENETYRMVMEMIK